MSEPEVMWQKGRWRLIDLGNGYYPQRQFQYENDGEWFLSANHALQSDFAEHYKKLRAVVEVARTIVNNSGQAAFSPQLAVRMLKDKLEALD